MTKARILDLAGFILALSLGLGIYVWRWDAFFPGLSAEQAESLTLAHSWISGIGLRWTSASSVTAGPPNLLWLGVQAATIRAGLSPEIWLPRIAALMVGASLVLVGLRPSLVWRRSPRLEDALPVIGLGAATALVEAGARGSGVSIWMFSLCLLSIGLGRRSGGSAFLGVAMGSLSLMRPSVVWLILMTVPGWWIASRMEGRKPLREAFSFLGGALLSVALVLGVRNAWVDALPLDGVFPSGDGGAGTLEFLVRQQRWFWAGLSGALVTSVWRRFHLRGGGILVGWVIAIVVLAWWSVGARPLFLGALPLLGMLIGDGLSSARDRLFAHQEENRFLSWAAVGAGLVGLALASQSSFFLGMITPVWSNPAIPASYREELEQRGTRQLLVVWSDGAEAAVFFPHARIVVARRPTAALEDQLLTEGPPDVVDARIPLETLPRLEALLSKTLDGARWLSRPYPEEDPRCGDQISSVDWSSLNGFSSLKKAIDEERLGDALRTWRCAMAQHNVVAFVNEHRIALTSLLSAKAMDYEHQGQLEQAVRCLSLMAELSGEDSDFRANAERLRARWLRERAVGN